MYLAWQWTMLVTLLLDLGGPQPPSGDEDTRAVAPAAAFAPTEAPPPPPPSDRSPSTAARALPEAPNSTASQPSTRTGRARETTRTSARPRLTGIGLIVASAISGGAVVVGSAWAIGRLSSCDEYLEMTATCYDAHAGLMTLFVFGHKPVADLGAGLAAGAGWHWSRWRHWRGHQHDAREYRRITWTGVGLFAAGVATEIVGASIYFSRYRWGTWGDRGAISIVAVLGSGALLRIIGAGLATFGWGGQRWARSDSGRASSLSTSRHPPSPRHHRL